MTLPAFAAERRRLQHGARSAPAAIDWYLLPARGSAANPASAAVAAVGRWDRRTDGRTPNRYIDLAPRIMRVVPKLLSVYDLFGVPDCDGIQSRLKQKATELWL